MTRQERLARKWVERWARWQARCAWTWHMAVGENVGDELAARWARQVNRLAKRADGGQARGEGEEVGDMAGEMEGKVAMAVGIGEQEVDEAGMDKGEEVGVEVGEEVWQRWQRCAECPQPVDAAVRVLDVSGL